MALPVIHDTTTDDTFTDRTDTSQYYNCQSVNNYIRLNRIGEGTYGTVYRGKHKHTGIIYALKKLNLNLYKNIGFPLTSIREIQLLQQLKHKNIVQLYDIVVGTATTNIYLLFEYVDYDLYTICMRLSRKFYLNEYKQLLIQLLSGVAYIHSNNIIHRDLKLTNLLLTKYGQVKIADFGLSRLINTINNTDIIRNKQQQLTPKVCTLWYRAPELILPYTAEYTTAIDIWAVGCIMIELLLFKPLFNGNMDIEQMQLICSILGWTLHGQWPDNYNIDEHSDMYIDLTQCNSEQFHTLFDELLTPTGIDLLLKLLDFNPVTRITAKHALKHPFFTEQPVPLDPSQMPNFPAQYSDETDIVERMKPPTPEAKLQHMHADETELLSTSDSSEYSDVDPDIHIYEPYNSDTFDSENDFADSPEYSTSIPIPTPQLRSMYETGMQNNTMKRKRSNDTNE